MPSNRIEALGPWLGLGSGVSSPALEMKTFLALRICAGTGAVGNRRRFLWRRSQERGFGQKRREDQKRNMQLHCVFLFVA